MLKRIVMTVKKVKMLMEKPTAPTQSWSRQEPASSPSLPSPSSYEELTLFLTNLNIRHTFIFLNLIRLYTINIF